MIEACASIRDDFLEFGGHEVGREARAERRHQLRARSPDSMARFRMKSTVADDMLP